MAENLVAYLVARSVGTKVEHSVGLKVEEMVVS